MNYPDPSGSLDILPLHVNDLLFDYDRVCLTAGSFRLRHIGRQFFKADKLTVLGIDFFSPRLRLFVMTGGLLTRRGILELVEKSPCRTTGAIYSHNSPEKRYDDKKYD